MPHSRVALLPLLASALRISDRTVQRQLAEAEQLVTDLAISRSLDADSASA